MYMYMCVYIYIIIHISNLSRLGVCRAGPRFTATLDVSSLPPGRSPLCVYIHLSVSLSLYIYIYNMYIYIYIYIYTHMYTYVYKMYICNVM